MKRETGSRMELCRIAFAFVICLFVHVEGQSQTCSASCSQWCGNEGLIFPGSNGRIVNVAFGKAASVSTPFSDVAGKSAPACIAVNGRTSTTYRSTTQPNTNCIHTGFNDYDASWNVDLGHDYTVTNITIYRRKGDQKRMAGLSVTVDGQLCHSFPNSSDTTALNGLEEKIDVTCSQPLTGRAVRLQKHGQDRGGAFYFINICEVQVWGCADAYVGLDCQCGHCRDGARCYVTTRECPGRCDKGWMTRFCNQSCPANKHGYDCSEQCGQCADSDTCNTVTGLCPCGCQPGWKGDDCKQKCDAGKYGNDCSSSCGNCSTGDVCLHTNGTCPRGCAAGFDPSDLLCKITCPRMQYGAGCAHRCGQCQNNAPCDVVTGHCDVCQPNLLLPLCQVCEGKMYGAQCDKPCSAQCGGDGTCDRNNGTCQAGCASGFLLGSGFCDEMCQSGAFGLDCAKKCGNCAESRCNHKNGTCEVGCIDGYVGDICSETSESSPNLAGPVAGGVFGGLCVIALSIVLVGLLIRRSRKRSSSETASPPQASADQNFEAGAPVGLNRQVTPQDETESAGVTEADESHIYDELQTPDDSDRAPYSTPVIKGKQDKGRHSHTYQNSALHTSDTGKD